MCPLVFLWNPKTSEAWVILLIKVTSMPIPIFGIINGIGFEVLPKFLPKC